jgi:hypothetical protein
MAYKKRIGAVLLPLALVGAWIGWHAWADYNWSRRVMEQKTKEGWVVATTYANLVDPVIAPWSIFKTPITRIISFKPSEVTATKKGLLLSRFLSVNYDYETTREDLYYEVIDCERNQSAVVNRDEFLSSPDMSESFKREVEHQKAQAELYMGKSGAREGERYEEEINRTVCNSFGFPLR